MDCCFRGTVHGDDGHWHKSQARRDIDERRARLLSQIEKKAAQTRITPKQVGLDLLCERLVIGNLVAGKAMDLLDCGVGNNAIELGVF